MSVIVSTEEAAETEPAWQGAGEQVGLQIWRIVVRTLPACPFCYVMFSSVLPRNNF